MSADQNKFLSTKEAGQLVGRSSDYVAKLVREGKISGKRIGRSWVIDENSLRTYFDLHVAQAEVKKEKLSLERQREYKAAQTPQKVIERSIVKIGNRLPISAEAFVGLTISLLVVFGSYSLIHASGIAALPGKLFDSVHELALSTNRNIVTFLNQPRIAEREDYVVARSVKEETSFGEVRIPNISFVDDRYTYVAPQDIFAATYVPAPPEFDFSLETLGATYLNFGTGVVNLAHGSVDAYTQFVDTLGKESFYSAQMMWGAAQNISDGLVNGYVTGITSFTSIAQTVPTRYETFVYEFVDASFKVATVLGTAPYIVGDQIVTSASVVPQSAHVLGSSVRTGAPTFSQNLGAGYVALIENFVFATYRLTDAYMDAVETAGAQIADVYFLVRFDIPAQAWMSMKGAYEGAVAYAKGEIQEAGDYIARKTTIPVVVLVTETTPSIGEVATTQVKVFEDTFESSLSRVQLAQAEGATSFFSRIRSGIENIFGRKPDPVLFVNPGPAQTNVVVREETPAPQQPRNITQNFYATTDVSKNYVDSSIKALHAALTAQFQSLSQANRNQIVQNIETIQLINRIEDISDTIIRRPEILGGFLRDVEITGASKFSGTRVRSDEFIGGTANFATTTLSNLTVNGDTTFTGTLTVGGLATTGALTAPYFTATSTTATSTFAGSFAIDTDGFVYATSTGNVGIGVLSPQALLSLRNATNTQAILTLSNAAGTEVGRFTDGGNFGIGTTSPYEKLSVDGNGVFTGTLSAATTTLSGRLAGTDAIFTNATITAATTTNFYSSVLRALSSTLTNLIATNATTTNATSTNFYTSVLNAVTGSITNFTATNATSTNLTVSSLTSGRIPYATTGGRLIDSGALTFDGITFNATDLIATRATTTNATTTNFSVSGALNLSGLTPSRALFLDGNGNVAISGASSLLANSLTDETGTGSVVFSASPTLTGTATLANYIATNGTTTNATSTNLAVSSALRLPNLTASRLVALNANGALTNSDLASWVAGTSNQITVADDGDGSITLSLPSQLSFTNFTATNGTTTNATSTNLAVTGSISVPADSFGTNEIADVYLLNTGDTATGDYNFDSNTLFIDSGDNRVGIGTNNPLKGLHVQRGGSSGLTSAFGDGLLFSTNSASGARIFLDNLAGGVNQKAAALVNENVNGVGTLYFGALSDNGGSWVQNHILAMNLATGNVGIGTSSPYAKLSVVGQAVAEYFTATSTTQASVFPRLTSTYATSTQLAVGSLTSGRIPYATTGGRLIDSSVLTFDGTTFNATDLTATRATTTNATSTNLAVSSALRLPNLTASRPLALDANGVLTNSSLASWVAGTSNQITVADDGDGSITLSLPSQLSFTNFTATNGTTTNATSTNLAISSLTSGRIPYATTGGRLIDSSSLTFDGSTVSAPRFVASSASATSTFAGGFAVETSGLVYDYQTNRVGIGTAAPALKTEIAAVLNAPNQDNGLRISTTGTPGTDAYRFLDISLKSAASGSYRAAFDVKNADSTGVEYEVLSLGLQSGNVGIGTTTPWGKLSVTNTGSGPSFVVEDAASPDITPFIIDASGRVGVGTAAPGNKVSLLIDSDDGISLVRSGWGTASGIFLDDDDQGENGLSIVGPSSRDITFSLNGNDSTDGFTVYTDPSNGSSADTFAFGVFNNGNVGIGDTSPLALLDVGGISTLTNSPSQFGVRHSTTLGITAGSYLYPTELQGITGGNNTRLQTALYRRGAGSTWQGTAYRLQYAVDNSFTDGSKAYVEVGGSDPSVAGGGFISLGTGGSDRLVVNNTGNIGIGTTTPDETLTIGSVAGNLNNQIAIDAAANRQAAITFRSAGVDKWYVGRGDSDQLSDSKFFIGEYEGNSTDAGGLNARLAIDSSGNVGIGTTTPAGKLSVVGTSVLYNTAYQLRLVDTNSTNTNTTGGTFISSNDGLLTFQGADYAGNGASIDLAIDQVNHRVGIGTTTPGVKLQVATNDSDKLLLTGSTDPLKQLRLGYSSSGNYGTIQAIQSGTAFTPLILNGSGGNVGIGTTTPSTLLNVVSTGSSGGGIVVRDAYSVGAAGGTIEAIGTRNDANFSHAFNGGLYLASHRSDTLFDGAGDVGYDNLGVIAFGANHTNGSLSNLAYSASITAIAEADFTNSSTMATALSFRTGTSGYAKGVVNQAIGTERLRIASNGNVGIGQASPANLLHVGGTTAAGRNFQVDSLGRMFVRFDDNSAQPSAWFINRGVAAAGNGATIQFQLADSGSSAVNAGYIGAVSENATYSGTTADSALVFRTAADGTDVERLRITSAGRVGIGTTSPDTALEVAGEITALGASDTFLIKKDNVSTGLYANSNGNLSFWVNGGQILTFEES